MTKKKEKETSEELLKENEALESETTSPEEDMRLLASALLEEKKQREAAQAALQEEKDHLLRTLAEYDNFKKRTAREKEDIYFAAQSDVIRKLLPVFDNFDRAQQFSDDSDYAKGVDMIIQQFFQIAEQMQIRQIAQVGDPFDPNLHEAVFREEKEGVEENAITEVLQKGYAVGDRVIRHAMVKVSG